MWRGDRAFTVNPVALGRLWIRIGSEGEHGSIFGVAFEMHFSVMDKTGDAIVIEYTEKRRQVYWV